MEKAIYLWTGVCINSYYIEVFTIDSIDRD
jgi:hypothetical protein